jgi:dynein heavy chain 1
VCNLPRPNSSRFEVFGSSTSGEISDNTFRRLIGMVPPQVIATAYGVIEERMVDVSRFIDQWLAYQTLWDTQISDVSAVVGKDISTWQALLVESADARSALDLSATTAAFGPISVKYNKVQSQVSDPHHFPSLAHSLSLLMQLFPFALDQSQVRCVAEGVAVIFCWCVVTVCS